GQPAVDRLSAVTAGSGSGRAFLEPQGAGHDAGLLCPPASEHQFGAHAEHGGGAPGSVEFDAGDGITHVGGTGAEIVIMDADAEAVGGVPAGADPGIPAVAAPTALQAQLLAQAVVVVQVIVGGPEVAAAHADVPGRPHVHARIGAHVPAAQGVRALALVDRIVIEHVAHADVAQVGVAAFDAQAPGRTQLP